MEETTNGWTLRRNEATARINGMSLRAFPSTYSRFHQELKAHDQDNPRRTARLQPDSDRELFGFTIHLTAWDEGEKKDILQDLGFTEAPKAAGRQATMKWFAEQATPEMIVESMKLLQLEEEQLKELTETDPDNPAPLWTVEDDDLATASPGDLHITVAIETAAGLNSRVGNLPNPNLRRCNLPPLNAAHQVLSITVTADGEPWMVCAFANTPWGDSPRSVMDLISNTSPLDAVHLAHKMTIS